MRLTRTFVRLPLSVDAAVLAAEVAALDEDVWHPHPSGEPGNTALPLVAVGGRPGDDRTAGPMVPTPQLTALPYTVRVLHALSSTIGRTRLMRIEQEGALGAHVDTNRYWWHHLRVHVPVVSDPAVRFECGGDVVHMAPGEVWVFDTWRPHQVQNPSGIARTHLVVDVVGGERLWDMVEHPDQPPHHVDAAAAEAVSVATELVNQPSVLSPWEVEANLDAVVVELAEVDAGAAARLAEALRPVRWAWRDAWARHGEGESGWAEFTALRDRLDALLERPDAERTLPNGVVAAEAVRQLVVRPAVAASTHVPAAQVASSTEPTGPRIERPVFVVCPPRSGSSLLFEVLARSPELATIGGESHEVIEGIAALHPAARHWQSNRLTAADAVPEVVAELTGRFLERLVGADGEPVAAGAVRLLEKTPKNALRVPFLAAAFPDACFVYLYRDPRESVSSMLEAWRSGRFVTYPQLPGWDGPPWSLLLVAGWEQLVGRPLGEVVAQQWATTTDLLLDDLEALEPDRWCVASYDRLVADPTSEVERLADFLDVERFEVPTTLPLSRHTLDSPHPDKWRRHADELQPAWERVRTTAVRAHAAFAAPPRIRPVRRQASPHSGAASAGGHEAFRSVHTAGFAQALAATGGSLAASTYQSGRVVLLRPDGDRVNTHLRGLAAPMGLALRGGRLAIGAQGEILTFQDQPAVAGRLEGAGPVDACFVPRRRHLTGDVRVHDLAFAGDELWFVNTRFSCLATLDDEHSFVPRWRPSFVSALAPEDRCHLNGLAVVDDAPRYVTALGRTDHRQGWREGKLDGGVVLDVPSGECVVDGLCMPHSPRWHDGRLWVLESGRGGVGVVDVESGRYQEVVRLPGFTRGLAIVGSHAFVGLSQVREGVFDGLPLGADERRCGVWVLDLERGTTLGWLEFRGIVQELYDVLLLPGRRRPELVEPGSDVLGDSFQLADAALAEVPEGLRAP